MTDGPLTIAKTMPEGTAGQWDLREKLGEDEKVEKS